MASEANVTVIGRSAILRGEITGECDVQIDGSLEGSVHVPVSRITVGPEAKVRALLSAKEIVVFGHVEGELRSTGRTELRSTATVTGNVFAARLAVEDEAVLRGHVDTAQAADNSAAKGAVSRGPQAWQTSTTMQEDGVDGAGSSSPPEPEEPTAGGATAQQPAGTGELTFAEVAEPKNS